MDIFIIKNNMSKNQMEIPHHFHNMEKLLSESVQKLRKIYSELRPTLLEHFGIGEAMRTYVANFQEESGIQCIYFQEPEEITLDDKSSISLYRILQGAVNNIKWHSLATRVEVRLEEKGPYLQLTIRDNGIGITEEQIKNVKSFGLIGMKERSTFLRGNIEIKGLPNKGTTIKVEIPLKQKNHNAL
jgi:signal transduction histidine kinase